MRAYFRKLIGCILAISPGILLGLAEQVACAEDSAESGASPDSGVSSGKRGNSSFRLHGSLLGAKAISGYQSAEFGWGGAGLAALEWRPNPVWGMQVEGGFIALGPVEKTPPNGLAELSASTGIHLALGLRGHPFAIAPGLANLHAIWLSAGLGVSMTGGHAAPLGDIFAGYDFTLSQELKMGPSFGYVLVMQTRESPRPDNANILLFGVHGSFGFAPQVVEDLDRDRDGIANRVDACPDSPEDRDGFEDEDGCPDLDNDEDNLVDTMDKCPNHAEDFDAFEDEDGCPDLDNDGDKILDANDKCPLEPEDFDEFEDADGCPELDNDQDKIPDSRDLCPLEPEIYNGIADNDGCPDSESIRVVGDKIELDQKIHFWTNSDRIRGMSYPVLNKLARFLIEHAEYVHVEVEGHADARGDAQFNLDLSRRRASSIKNFLLKKGLQEERVSSEGFGSERPLVEGSGERTWFMNRRVEFIVTRNRQEKYDPESGAATQQGAPAFGVDAEKTK